jgi:hypothetical protein
MLFFADGRSAATSWRINNNATRHAHFTDINAAMSSTDVVDGDTIYIDPGCTLTTNQTVSKRVTIIGTGYFLNNDLQPATVNANITLKSAYIKVVGLQMTKTVYIGANNVTLERCNIGKVLTTGTTAQYATIRQCYFPNGVIEGAGKTNTSSTHWTIENCIIIYTDNYDPIQDLYFPIIRNNYIRPNYSKGSASVAYVSNGMMVNNICINTKFIANANPYEMTDCVITNNVFHVASLKETYPNNVFIDENTEEAVFALEGTNDQRYQLKEDSPAKGAANDGGDCGPFGGLYPYVFSGLPFGQPYFNSSSASFRATDGKVSFSNEVTIQTK